MIYGPREDSYLLQKYVKQIVKRGDKVLDMGAGSGIQAITALEITGDVTAVDINPKALEKIKNEQPWVKALESDLFKNLNFNDKFDVIIFNPPYLPRDSREPKDSSLSTTGGKEGHEIIQKFLKQARSHLEPQGIILLIYSSLSGDIENIACFFGYNLEVLETISFDFEKIHIAKLTAGIVK